MEGHRNSGIDAVGMLMTSGMDDDDDSDDEDGPQPAAHLPAQHDKHAALLSAASQPQLRQPNLPLAAPQPSYAAPVSALNLGRPKPAVLNTGLGRNSPPEMSQAGYPSAPPTPNTAYSVPSSPHPLQAPSTPIVPVFARASPAPRDVKFAAGSPIPRGNSEDTLISRGGAKGDDFWKRFSMVVREDNQKPANEKTRCV